MDPYPHPGNLGESIQKYTLQCILYTSQSDHLQVSNDKILQYSVR
jgi:hypothetical protein